MRMKSIRKKRRSLVRILASCIPNFVWEFLLPVSPRMYISASVMEKISDFVPKNSQSEDESFSVFQSYICNKKETANLYSTPLKDESQNQLTALQRELDEIKKQVAKLMEHQCEQLQSSEYETPTNSQQKSFVPPPPPPPLPNFQLTPVNTPLKFENKKFISQPIRNGLPSGKELLKDLKKVQLRKIDKSPGGGPLKKPKQINDPGDFLEAVLKRRFGLIQNSPDSSLESVSIEANNSFNSVSHCANYSDGRNFKSTVY